MCPNPSHTYNTYTHIHTGTSTAHCGQQVWYRCAQSVEARRWTVAARVPLPSATTLSPMCMSTMRRQLPRCVRLAGILVPPRAWLRPICGQRQGWLYLYCRPTPSAGPMDRIIGALTSLSSLLTRPLPPPCLPAPLPRCHPANLPPCPPAPQVRALLERQPGVGRVMDGGELDAWYAARGHGRARGRRAHHKERSGSLTCVAAEGHWFAYYYWEDDRMAPDFARCKPPLCVCVCASAACVYLHTHTHARTHARTHTRLHA